MSSISSLDQIQQILDSKSYVHPMPRGQLGAKLLADQESINCLGGAVVAAYLAENLGYDPLILSLIYKNSVNHAVFCFEDNNNWKAYGASRQESLKHRLSKQFTSQEQLAMSYNIAAIDANIVKWGIANLNDTDIDWRNSTLNIKEKLENFIRSAVHYPVFQ